MTVDLAVSGGTLVTPEGTFEGTLLVEDEQIAGAVSADTAIEAESVVDVDGSLVMPGVVDPHVHVAGPNTMDTYESGSRAAALGGVTSFISFAWQAWESPDTPWAEPGTLRDAVDRKYAAAESSLIDFGVHATITQEDQATLDELEALVERGVVSFKMFTAYEFGLGNGFIEQVFDELAALGAVAVLHTEDPDVCAAREAEMRKAGRGAPSDYPDSRPPHAEAMAADDAVRMARNAGVKYYGIHTSCRESAAVIESAQTDKSLVRGETCVHYTTLDRDIYERLGTLPMLAPPLRSPDDKEAMFEHLAKETLDVVSTDHVAFTREAKQTEQWWDSEFGSNSIQRSLPVFHDEAVVRRGISYPKLVELMCSNPARLFGLTGKGTLEPGTDADFLVFDPEATQTITADENASKADYSIYEGREVTGRVERTYLRGKCIAAEGEIREESAIGELIDRTVPDWRR
jgi:dihydropyrimidinase